MKGTEEVARLAALARLSIGGEEQERFAKEFESIIAYVDTLSGLSVDLGEGRDGAVPATNVFRADEHPYPAGAFTEAITAQFPKREGDSLAVKQIISHD